MRWLSVVAASMLSGCAVPEPEPIDPAAVAAKFASGSLSDPGLLAYLEAHRPRSGLPGMPASWDLPALTLVAFYYHPELDVARSRLALAQAAELTAAAPPNPQVGAGLQRTFDILRGVSPWTYGFDFTLPVELGGKRRYRRARALHLSEAAHLELAATGWRVRSHLRAALVEHLLAAQEREVLRAEGAARSRALTLMEERLAAGAVSQPGSTTEYAEIRTYGLDHTHNRMGGRHANEWPKRRCVLATLGKRKTPAVRFGSGAPQAKRREQRRGRTARAR